MTFRQFVITNVFRNKRLYAAYFLSSLFTVMVFFTFAMFAFHPAFQTGNINSNALLGMSVAGGIIYVFSFFFVLYSMSSFLQSRKKEFGLLTMQGMSMRQIKWMVFLENMCIGILSTITGIAVGTLFAKLILLIAENVLVLDESLYFYVPLGAIVITFASFTLLFVIISFFVTFVLRSKKLAELIKGDKQPKAEPKASLLLTLLAILLLGVGYVTALLAKGAAVMIVMIPVIVVVVIGTYLLFTQISVYMIRFLKKRKSIFWKKTNMILFSDLSFRMKDNARTFFMVAIISTVAFSAIGTLFGFSAYLTKGIKEANPYSFTYYADDKQTDKELEDDLNEIRSVLGKDNIDIEEVDAELHYYTTVDGKQTLIATESTYNAFAELVGQAPIHVKKNEVIGVKHSPAMIEGFEDDTLADQPIQLDTGEELTLTKVIEGVVLPELNAHYIISDESFEHMPVPIRTERNVIWQAVNGEDEALIHAGEILNEKMSPSHFQAIDYTIYTVNKTFGPILFIGLFIGIVFFVSAGSFLYFRLFTDLDEDKAKFRSIAKMGLTNQELKKVITRQTAILFFAPIVVAMMHGAVALTALSHFFNFNLVREASLVLGSFFVIQVIYFFIVRLIYIRQVKSAL